MYFSTFCVVSLLAFFHAHVFNFFGFSGGGGQVPPLAPLRTPMLPHIGGGTGGPWPLHFFSGRASGALIYGFISTILPLHECI